ncbi:MULTISPECIES: hypothetical protein [unclassified Microbacterium]|uniref:hypothetical protein n=1 Tax=unclassified Microbacterium TaxID=2609290 RepID=UPI0012F87D12|nr:hypothetical protein [Microbacterium sp. MAH-37]MVQ40646.1 hypothetical protein [Microbacterium sp. MAH-37]
MPRSLAIIFFALAVFFSAGVIHSNLIAVPLFLVPAMLLLVTSCRVKAGIQDDSLVIRSYWTTRRFPLRDLDLVAESVYGG